MNDKVSSERVEFPLSVDNFKGLSQETAHLIIAAMIDGVTVVGLDGKILECNDAVLRLHGVSREEYVGKSVYDFIAPEDRQRAIQEASEVLQKGHLRSEVKALRKEGGTFDAEINVSVLRDASGEPVAFLGVTRDITEWNKKKEELVRLSSAVKMSADSIVISDIDAKIIDVNEATLKMHGTDDKRDLIGKNSFTLIAPEERGKALEGMKEVLEKGYITGREYHVITKDGSKIPVGMSVAIIKDVNGKPIGFVGISRDITERKKAEEALRASEQRFRCLVEGAAAGVGIIGLKGRFTYVNKTLADSLGYSVQEFVGRPFKDFLHPSDRGKVVRLFLKSILLRRQPQNIEFRVIRKDGLVLHWISKPTRLIINGKTVGFEAIITDITERKKAEERVRESEEKYRNLFENARDVIFTADLKGNITDINRFVEEYDFKRDEVVGKNMLKFVPKKYWPKLLKELSNIARGKLVEGEIEIITPKGKIIAEYRSNPIRQGKKVVGFQTILRNITKRKEMEQKLRQYSEQLGELVQKRTEELLESERRYSVLVEEASDGVAILQDEKIVFANKRATEIVGYSQEELIGLPIAKLVNEKYLQIATEHYQGTLLQGETLPLILEIELINKTGENILTEISGRRINHYGRPAVLVILRDVRERKRMEEQRLRLEKLATMGELATMVAHDLRNPLTSIRNAAFYIKNTCLARANAECKASLEMLEIVEKETLAASNIVNDLLDFAARRPLQKKNQNINSLIDDSLKRMHIPENINVERKHAKKATAAVDEKQLERVFVNLTKNAVQAMPNGGTLTIATNETKDQIEIAFTDTGTGIQEENMNKLFSPLFTTKAKGIGMGLAICKKIIEQHGGTIEAQSKAGQGTTFKIKLPKKQEENAQ